MELLDKPAEPVCMAAGLSPVRENKEKSMQAVELV